MLDFFGNNNTKIPQKSPKKHKICGACPPSGKPIEPLKFPKFSFGSPKKDTKVVTLVDMSKYRHKNEPNNNSLF